MGQAETNERFIKINNQFFFENREISDMFYKIGTMGFVLLCYILSKIKEDAYLEISLYFIEDYFKATKQTITNPKDKRTIKKYLKILQDENLITITNRLKEKIDINKVKPKDIIIITVNNIFLRPQNNFNSISTQLFNDYISNIGSIGWSILCLLSRLHNYTYGNSGGYAKITEETMTHILVIGTTSIKKYINLLEKYELVKIIEQQAKFCNKKKEWTPYPNKYVVKHKLVGDKYYLKQYDNAREKLLKEQYIKENIYTEEAYTELCI